MEKSSQTTKNRLDSPVSPHLSKHLTRIAKHAGECLKSGICEIYLRHGESVFSLAAGYGHPEGGFHKGAELILDSDALSHLRTSETTAGGTSVHGAELMLPITNGDGEEEQVLALMCVRAKHASGEEKQSHVAFTPDDMAALRPFADAVACALEFAGQGAYAEQLVASAPVGVIAIDGEKRITGFNRLAQELFKYKAEDVLGQPVGMLCANPEEPERVLELLQSTPGGKPVDYETFVRSSEGERIPVRLEATWMLDAQGEHAGGVIYFSDLRAIRKAEINLTHLLRANDLFAGAESETKSLQLWAEMFVHLLKITFCRIFLIDETHEYLIAKAAHPISRAEGLDWSPGLEEPTAIGEWPRMLKFLEQGAPVLLSMSGKTGLKLLEEWSARLKLKSEIQTMLVIPLKTESGLVGLLDLGELRTVERASFSTEKRELATAIANQLARIIDHTRLHKETERRRQLLTSLSEKSLHMRGSKETSALLIESVRLAAELVGGAAGGLYIFDEHLQELVLEVGYKIPSELLNSRIAQDVGLIGLVMRERKPQVIYDYSRRMINEDFLKSSNFQTVVAVPLLQAGKVAAVLFVADSSQGRRITQSDLEALEHFAAHTSMAWQISRLISQEQRVFTQLASLHGISDYIEAARDVDTILNVLLTGITAGYGLGFNRAAVFLLDELRECLVGSGGIGYLEESEAQKDWQLHYQRRLEDFAEYLKRVEQGNLPPSPIGERIPGLRLPLNSDAAATGLFSQVILKRTPRILDKDDDLEGLPQKFVEVFEPSVPAVIIPLVAREQVLGLLIADTKFTQSPISPERVESLLKFVNTAAIAIDNATLLQQARDAKERLHGLLRARNALIPSKEPQPVLQDAVDQILLAADASWVRLILISETGEKQSRIDKIAKAGADKEIDYQSIIRPGGTSMTVMSEGTPITVEDTAQHPNLVSPSTLAEGSRAYVCLPFAVQEKPIGVIWLHYDTPRKFLATEIEALHRYADHAADVYASSRRLEYLENLRKAADNLAEADSTQNVLQQIVDSTMTVLNADSAVLWDYDAAQDSFILQNSVAAGIPETLWEELRATAPRKKGTAYRVMKVEWLSVGDVSDEQQYSQLGTTSRRLLKHIKGQAVQCVALSVGKEHLGVLYANYKSPQFFSDEDRSLALYFAYHAALVLKRAKLIDQMREAKEWADAGARVTVLRGREVALKSIAVEAKQMSHCDAVVIFEYDRKTRRLRHPPMMLDVLNESEASKSDEVLRGSLVYAMLEMREPYVAEDVHQDKHFKGRRFAEDEGVKSCIALPLRFAGEEIGVMFLNYRSTRSVTTEELKNIELFANQSAVAIQNTQVFEERIKGLSIQESLVELSRILFSAVGSEETLKHAVAVAAKEMRADVCSILTPDPQGVFSTRASEYAPANGDGQTPVWGEMWQVIGEAKEGESPPDRLPESMYGMCVPIYKEGVKEGQVIGVLQVQTLAPRHFILDEVNFLWLVANQTAIAFQSAQRFEEVERKRLHLEALNKASKAITRSFGLDRSRILMDIVHVAYDCINSIAGHNVILSTIQLYDKANNKLIFGGVFPFDEYPRVLQGLDERYSLENRITLDRTLAPQGKIGITGRAVEKKETQLINDVSKDSDYLIFDSRTRSQLAVPLLDQNKVLGVFNVESDRIDGFDMDDVETLQSLAELVVIAIDNALLYQQEELHIKEIEAIADISKIINASLNLNETLNAILKSTGKLIKYTAAEINFWDDIKQGTVVFASSGYPGYTHEAGGFYEQDEGFTGQIVRSRGSLLIENTSDVPHIPPKVIDPDKPIRSCVGVPLLIGEGERYLGTLELVSDIPNKYSEKDMHLLERIGLLAEVAIKNAERARKFQSAAYAAALAAQALEIAHTVKSEAGAILRKLYILRNHYEIPAGAQVILNEIEDYSKSLIPRKEDYSGMRNPYPATGGKKGKAELDKIVSAELALAGKRWIHLTIEEDLNAAGLIANISESDLKRLLRHLLHNSAKAIKSANGSGRIVVRTLSNDSFIFLQVEDDGPGIPEELKSRLLWAPIPKEDGLGWGLLTVRLTVESYDGQLLQVKPRLGEGTGFKLRFNIAIEDKEAGE